MTWQDATDKLRGSQYQMDLAMAECTCDVAGRNYDENCPVDYWAGVVWNDTQNLAAAWARVEAR